MRHPVRALALVVSLVVGTLVSLSDPAAAGSPGWLVVCTYAKAAKVDPIVMPGMVGMSHKHDFVGNRSTSSTSTYGSMLAGSSTCKLKDDTAGYWTPALYRNGVKVHPAGSYAGRSTRQQIYYRDNAVAVGTKVRAFPKDLRMIAGVSKATSVAGNPLLGHEIYWGCSDNSVPGKPVAPPAHCDTGIITLHVGFPSCWDGVHLDSDDHKSHMAYPHGGRCPASHPVAVPRVKTRWEYPVGTTTGRITLASGPTWTVHGDFWNTWKQSTLVDLVSRCLNADQDCGKPTS